MDFVFISLVMCKHLTFYTSSLASANPRLRGVCGGSRSSHNLSVYRPSAGEDVPWKHVVRGPIPGLRSPFPPDSSTGWLDCSQNVALMGAILSFFLLGNTVCAFPTGFGDGAERPWALGWRPQLPLSLVSSPAACWAALALLWHLRGYNCEVSQLPLGHVGAWNWLGERCRSVMAFLFLHRSLKGNYKRCSYFQSKHLYIVFSLKNERKSEPCDWSRSCDFWV